MKFLKEKINNIKIDPYKLRGDNFYENILEDNNKHLLSNKQFIKQIDDFKCVLCGGDRGKNKLTWRDNYCLIECDKCEAISANIEQDNIEEIYQNCENYNRYFERVASQFEYRKNTFGLERFDYVFNRLNLDVSNVELLDIGCGFGYFLECVEDNNASGKGLELDPLQVKFCRGRGLNVDSNSIEEEPSDFYNVVTMFDVLEHLSSPIDFFKSVNRILEKNGKVVLYTPNIHSVGFELMRSEQNLLHPFQHVCFYNDHSLEYLATNSGFRVDSIEYYGLDIMDYLLFKEYKDNWKYAEKLKDMVSLVQGCLDKLEVSNHLRVTLSKVA